MAEELVLPQERGFRVFSANSTEILSKLCSILISDYPPADPFAEEKILVMNRGMETYLVQSIASNNEVAACLRFYQPWSFIWETLRKVFPKAGEVNYFSREYVTWSLMGMLQNRQHEFKDPKLSAVYSRVSEYLADDGDETKAYEFCAQLAHAFDQYQMLRPDWISCWNTFKPEDFDEFLNDPQGVGKIASWVTQAVRENTHAQKVLYDNIWQMALWSKLAFNLKGANEAASDDPSYYDRSSVMTALIDRLKCGASSQAGLKALKQVLPHRLFVFGTASLPPIVIEFLKALSACVSVNFMLLNPCEDYWGDIRPVWGRSFGEYKKRLASYSGNFNCVLKNKKSSGIELKANNAVMDLKEPNLKNFDFLKADGERVSGHPLLLSLGREEMELLTLLLDGEDCADFVNAFEEGEPCNMLETIKHDLLHLREDDHVAKRHRILPEDDSLSISSCHTIKREIEVLHDNILGRFKRAYERQEVLEPRDFIVMVPDIESYAPYIDSVFGSVPKDSPKYLPYSISDRTEVASGLIGDAVLKLLDIGVNRITASLVEDLLSVPAIAAKFGIEASDVETIGRWCSKAGIHWGLDDSDASKLILDSKEYNNLPQTKLPWTFDRGLKRMLDGYMSGADPSGVNFTEIEGGDAVLMGNFCDFIEKLTALREVFIPELSPDGNNWQQEINDRILTVFFNDDESTDQERSHILQIVGQMQETVSCLQAAPKITLPVFSAFMKKQLSLSAENQPFLRGSINFCSLMPMRAVPFKHIYILGLNESDFPRKDVEPGFNLIFAGGLKRRGDRSRINDDRCLILEALLSAQKSICFSYIGESPVNQKELAPSAVLSEIEDYLGDLFTIKAEDNVADGESDVQTRLIQKHHLSSYNLDNFISKKATVEAQGRLASFDENSFIGGTLAVGTGLTQDLFASLAGNDDWQVDKAAALNAIEVDLNQLISCFTKPARYFLKYGLGISLNQDFNNEKNDDEPFALDDAASSHYQADRLVSSLLEESDVPIEEKVDNLGRRGLLPYGVLAESDQRYLIKQSLNLQRIKWEAVGKRNVEKRRYEAEISSSFCNIPFKVLIRGEISSPGVIINCFSDNEVDPLLQIKAWLYSLCLSLSKAPSSKVICVSKDGKTRAIDWKGKKALDLGSCLEQLVFWFLKIRFSPLLSNKKILQIQEKQNGNLKKWLDDPLNVDPPDDLFAHDEEGKYLFEGSFSDSKLLTKLAKDTRAFREFFIETIYQNNE